MNRYLWPVVAFLGVGVLCYAATPTSQPDSVQAAKDRLSQRQKVRAARDADELPKVIAKLREENASLKSAVADRDTEIARLTSELSRFNPGPVFDKNNVPVVKLRDIDLVGERFENQRVRISRVIFDQASDRPVYQPLDKTVDATGKLVDIDYKNFKLDQSFAAHQGTDFLASLFVVKADFADLLLTINRDSELNLEGFVVRLDGGGRRRYGLLCSKIEIIKGGRAASTVPAKS